jgi:hypothetical protein
VRGGGLLGWFPWTIRRPGYGPGGPTFRALETFFGCQRLGENDPGGTKRRPGLLRLEGSDRPDHSSLPDYHNREDRSGSFGFGFANCVAVAVECCHVFDAAGGRDSEL